MLFTYQCFVINRMDEDLDSSCTSSDDSDDESAPKKARVDIP